MSTDLPFLTRPIPSTGELLPAIGLGTWQAFDVGVGEAERAPLEEVLRTFVALGGRLVDSSPMYGRSEQVVGDISERLQLRPKLFVATKVWTEGRSAGIAQMERSMRLMRADPIDLMQVHNLVDATTHLDTLRGWKKDGRVRYIGVTHYTATYHDIVGRVVRGGSVDFIQINYSALEPEAGERLLPLAREHGVAVIANRPLGSGAGMRRIAAKPLPAWAAEIGCTGWGQLLLKWVLADPAVTCAIPATRNVEHLRDNMRAAIGPLPDDRMRARIAEAVR